MQDLMFDLLEFLLPEDVLNLSSINTSFHHLIYQMTHVDYVSSCDEEYELPDANLFVNLISLYTAFTDINYLRNFPRLQRLKVLGCDQLSDITSLTNLKSLTITDETKITDLSHLTNLIRLKLFDVVNITDISSLTNLKSLTIGHCGIENISNLTNLTKLSILFSTKINDISKLTNLRKLDISGTRSIKNISNLSNLATIIIDGDISVHQMYDLFSPRLPDLSKIVLK